MQLDAFEKAGVEKVFTEKESGRADDRTELDKALKFAREGDTFVVWRFDRLGRNTLKLIQWVNELRDRKIAFVSLTEAIDTTTPIGECMFTICAAFAQLEWRVMQERTRAGLEAARKRGVVGGRKMLPPSVQQIIAAAAADPNTDIPAVCKTLDIGKSTFYRYARALAKPERKAVTIYDNGEQQLNIEMPAATGRRRK